MELKPLGQTTNNNGEHAYLSNDLVTAGNGDDLSSITPEAAERESLLPRQIPGSNGAANSPEHAVEAQDSLIVSANGNTDPSPQEQISAVCKIKRELNDVIFWKFRLWMVIIFIFVLILVVIGISLILCTVIHEDVDEKFDPSSFEFPRYFNGSFRLTNQIFTDELLSPSSNQSKALSTELQEKLADLYRASHALGRYFSKAEIFAFRNGSVIAQYQLKFLMPELNAELKKFTLSREVVYNVLRQFLYDQETDHPDPLYIDPASLDML